MRTLLVVMAVVAAAPAAPAQPFLGRKPDQWLRKLADGTPSERRSAAFALGKFDRPSDDTLKGLSAALRGKDAALRDAAAFALGEVAAAGNADRVWEQAGEDLLDRLQDEDPRVR